MTTDAMAPAFRELAQRHMGVVGEPDPYPLDLVSVADRLAALDCGPHEALKRRLVEGSAAVLAHPERTDWAAELGRIVAQCEAISWTTTA